MEIRGIASIIRPNSMRRLQILGPREGCLESALRNAERGLGLDLPSEYRCFLQATDGGIAGSQNRFVDARLHKHLQTSILVERFLCLEDLLRMRHELRHRIASAFLTMVITHSGISSAWTLRP
jgi:cell wall assembly regulator SMI1